MQKYMLSFKNIYSENINAGNLLFVTGPTKVGKSNLVRHNMKKFMNMKDSIVFHFDFGEHPETNFD